MLAANAFYRNFRQMVFPTLKIAIRNPH